MDLIDTFFNTQVMLRAFPILMRGLGNTVVLGITTIICGSIAGLLLCLARLYAPAWVRLLAIVYIDVFRALPALVTLILIYYALPFLGIRIDSFPSAILALSIVFAAFFAEICRAGIESIPKSQFEAALALGLPFPLTMAKVILPQAFRNIVPPYTSSLVAVFKDTSLASVVAVSDLLKQANDAQALTANPTPLILAAAIYLILLWPMVRLVGYLEARQRQSAASR